MVQTVFTTFSVEMFHHAIDFIEHRDAQSGNVLYVSPNGGGNCSTINSTCSIDSALQKASSGTKILITAGDYNRFNVNKSVTIEALNFDQYKETKPLFEQEEN